MKTISKLFIAAIVLTAVSCSKQPVKVACMGDSITFGWTLANPDSSAYPALLGARLGQKYTVRNFGVCGVTAQDGTDMPYTAQSAYSEALAFNPDIVTLCIGTNDSKPFNWHSKEQFKQYLTAMVGQISALPSAPKIWLFLPTPAMGDAWSISDSVIEAAVVPAVREVASELGLPTVDLNTPFQGQRQYFPDTIHPNEQGDSIIADIVYNAIFK